MLVQTARNVLLCIGVLLIAYVVGEPGDQSLLAMLGGLCLALSQPLPLPVLVPSSSKEGGG